MKTNVYLSYGTLISPLGIGIEQHFTALKEGKSGIKEHPQSGFNQEDWYLSKIDAIVDNRFDTLLKLALEELKKSYSADFLSNEKTLFIVSSTKGNIDALPNDVFHSTREIIKQETNNPNEIVIISNACISGVIAINNAADYIQYSDYENVIVIGIDIVSDFVLYGFQSLFAMSTIPTKPFDKNRKGISLGEACGIVVASKNKPTRFAVNYLGGSTSNDANHISGPSRTGEGLVRTITKTIAKTSIASSDIDFVSAHGTGTLYNDEMESIAFSRTNLQHKPINSLKGVFGHTLGAAGVIETIVSMLSLEHQILFKSIGFEETGTSHLLNIITETHPSKLQTILKTASGFGGGNALLILNKL